MADSLPGSKSVRASLGLKDQRSVTFLRLRYCHSDGESISNTEEFDSHQPWFYLRHQISPTAALDFNCSQVYGIVPDPSLEMKTKISLLGISLNFIDQFSDRLL